MKVINYSLLLLVVITLLNACKGEVARVVKLEFSKEQISLIEEGDSLTSMRVLKITNRKDSLLLREESKDVTFAKGDSSLYYFSKRLVATVQDTINLGVGIAAPQVGILKNIICVQRFDKEEEPFEVYYNPTITQYTKKTQPCKEGCLSIPGRSDTLEIRAYAILLEYNNLNGEHQYEMIEDFTAVIFQHEIDHLKGILYTDYLHEKAHAEGRKH